MLRIPIAASKPLLRRQAHRRASGVCTPQRLPVRPQQIPDLYKHISRPHSSRDQDRGTSIQAFCKNRPHQWGQQTLDLHQYLSCPHSSRDQDLGTSIQAFCENGRLNEALSLFLQYASPPPIHGYLSLLKACSREKALLHTRHIQAHITQHALDLTGLLGHHLIVALAKCGALDDAHSVFLSLPDRTVFSWTAMISGYTECGHGKEALDLRSDMQEDGVVPSPYTFVSLLKACASIGDLSEVEKLHTDCEVNGFTSFTFVGSTLVSIYGSLGCITEAECVFVDLLEHDVISWNALLSAYCGQKQIVKAFRVYQQMKEECVTPNQQTFMIILQVCATLVENEITVTIEGRSIELVSLEIGKALHADAYRTKCAANAFVGSILLNMYGKCNGHHEAENVFDQVSLRNVVFWSAMLSAYVEQGHGEKALLFYRQMQCEGVAPNQQTFVIALQACGAISAKEESIDCIGPSRKWVALKLCKALHSDARKNCYTSDVFVGNTLVNIYGKCGSIVDAEIVFQDLSERDILSWSVLLDAYVGQGHEVKALKLYRQMLDEHVNPNCDCLLIVLQACSALVHKQCIFLEQQQTKTFSLDIGRALHADAKRKGFTSDMFIHNTLVNMYGKYGSIMEAQSIFEGLPKNNTVSWNVMLAAYVEVGQGARTLQLYRQMHEEDVSTDQHTLAIALKACSVIVDVQAYDREEGQQFRIMLLEVVQALHRDAKWKGFYTNPHIATTLISMYSKCNCIEKAEIIFSDLSWLSVTLWNVMLSTYIDHGQGDKALLLYRQMQQQGAKANHLTFVTALQALQLVLDKEEATFAEMQPIRMMPLELGWALHADAQRMGFTSEFLVVNCLIVMYGMYGSIAEAENVFVEVYQPDVGSWNAMFTAYVNQGQEEKVLWLYSLMLKEGVNPNQQTLVIALQAISGRVAAILSEEELAKMAIIGKALHADAVRLGFVLNIEVGNTLVSMYGKCGDLVEAENLFCALPHHDLVSWNMMLSAFVEQGKFEKGLKLYRQMQAEIVGSNEQTFVMAFQACGNLPREEGMICMIQVEKAACLRIGKALHADAQKQGIAANVFAGSSLVKMYSKCGCIQEAECAFSAVSQCNVVLWNVMITAYLEHGQNDKALQLYRQMQEENVSPNQQTFVIILQSCRALVENKVANASDGYPIETMQLLKIVRAVHADAHRKGLVTNVFVSSTLVTLYGKCGSLVEAETVFTGLSQLNTVLWNAMLTAYVEQGQDKISLELYRHMQEEHAIQDEITLMTVLQACCEVGELEACRKLHFDAVSTGYEMNIALANTLVCAYGSCANMADAQAIFDGLVQPDSVSWNVCIAGYAQEGNCNASFHMFQEMQLAGYDPDQVTFVSLLSACSHTGFVTEGVECFKSMSKVFGLYSDSKHYATMIDLLGRAGDFERIQSCLLGIPIKADLAIWLCLLGACCTHGNVEFGKQAFEHAIFLQPKESSAYILMSNTYADVGCEIVNLSSKAIDTRPLIDS